MDSARPRTGSDSARDGSDAGAAGDSPTVVRGSSASSRRASAASRTAPPPPMPRPGDVIDTFALEEAIGAGGMGAVFRARDGQLDRQVALKLLPPDQADDPEVVARFYQEGRAAAQLDHENIARVHSLGQDGIYHYIVFEFIEGTNLRQRVDERGPSTVGEAVDVTLQIAQALVHAAERGVVHRDIKPSNIIITPQGRAKLVDMGLARRFERRTDRGLTQTGMTLGTFDYISPEQARDPRDVDVRSDLYSLGCTLYHMLTGQPPFPGGTVLQKLIQHQEEDPPDVRSLNPSVPPALARVLDKLMAKDRDRRHQSPEQLVRDLLVAAGQAGIPLPRVESSGWTPPPTSRPAWERHLVLLLPTLGFMLLAAGLLLWGREPVEPAATSPIVDYDPLRASRPQPLQPTVATGIDAAPAPAPAVSRNITVRPGDDLAAALAAAPPKSVVTLTDDGPYLLGGGISGAGARVDAPLVNKDLTIRADAGKRPVLKFAADARSSGRSSQALLTFVKGRVTLEGLIFEVSGRDRDLDDHAAAILVDDAELRLKGCLFRRDEGDDQAEGAGLPAIRSRVAGAGADLPPPVVADQCHFNTGAPAIECEGPADVQITDCTFGPGGTVVRLDGGQAATPSPSDVLIRRASLMAGESPVFQVQGAPVRFQVEQCVLAPGAPGSAPKTLLLVDAPANLTWHGRSNLFGSFDVYLEADDDDDRADAIRDFDRWSELPGREVRSLLVSSPIWRSADPAQDLALDLDDPTRAFQLAAVLPDDSIQRGARRGPFGAMLIDPEPVRSPFPFASAPQTPPSVASESRPSSTEPTEEAGRAEIGPPKPLDASLPTVAVAAADTDANADADPAPAIVANREPNVPSMPPMITITTPTVSPEDVATPPLNMNDEPERREAAAPSSRDAEEAWSRPKIGHEDLIGSSAQLVNTLVHRGTKGGELWIARGVDLELSTIDIPGPATWSIEAEPGDARPRPRLRFHPSVFAARSTSTWATLFHVPGGKLRLRGLDILIDDPDPMSMSRLAAVCLAPGAELELIDCTITLERGVSRNAIVTVLSEKSGGGPSRTDSDEPAVVRVIDSFLRSAGDAFLATPDRRFDCELRNSLIVTDGSLLHALGSAEPVEGAPLQLKLDRVLARVKGGLVHLESSMDEPELPQAVVQAENSILSVGVDGAPLFRVDGRGSLESLRDRIRWTGANVGYHHQITIYRRDDTGQTGVRPRNYLRADWTNIFAVTDESPTTEVEFPDKTALALPSTSVTRDDLRASTQGPLRQNGPDLDRVPKAPRADF